MKFTVKVERILLGKVWLCYFFLTIGVIGAIGAYALAFPLAVVGRFYKPSRKASDFILQNGIFFLMWVQPWFRNAQVIVELPQAPYPKGLLVVANHRSHLDAFVILSRFKGVRMFATRSLFFNPFIGPMLWATRQIPVDRSPDGFVRAIAEIGNRLDQGELVLVFPELTRCSPGYTGVQSFSASPFQVAIKRGTPILPLVIANTDGVWPKGEFNIHRSRPIQVKTLKIVETHPDMTAVQVRNSVASDIATELTS